MNTYGTAEEIGNGTYTVTTPWRTTFTSNASHGIPHALINIKTGNRRIYTIPS